MKDAECVEFLQWALPRMGFRWAGYRKVRRQVCKRIQRRFAALGIGTVAAYRRRLAAAPEEWAVLDSLCRITITRFWRDRGTFEALGDEVLPELAEVAEVRGDGVVRCWSAGCGGGEEPYSLAILWKLAVARRFPSLALEVEATDADETMLRRARAALYSGGSLKDMPPAWTAQAFEPIGRSFELRPRFRRPVRFRRQDIRRAMPPGPFDLILCRNLAFTYFDEAGQRRLLKRLLRRLRPGGALVLGGHETLPEPTPRLVGDTPGIPVYRLAD
jgi:chemotaxis protein methyltransferase CheR